MIRYRNLGYGDRIPDELTIGFRQEDLTQDLVWVCADEKRILGCVLAFAAHGFFYPQRVAMVKDAPKFALLRLLRKAFRDARDRGYHYFMVIIDNEAGDVFEHVILQAGGSVAWESAKTKWLGGSVDPLIRARVRNSAIRRSA